MLTVVLDTHRIDLLNVLITSLIIVTGLTLAGLLTRGYRQRIVQALLDGVSRDLLTMLKSVRLQVDRENWMATSEQIDRLIAILEPTVPQSGEEDEGE